MRHILSKHERLKRDLEAMEAKIRKSDSQIQKILAAVKPERRSKVVRAAAKARGVHRLASDKP
jgi:hypothetical protein